MALERGHEVAGFVSPGQTLPAGFALRRQSRLGCAAIWSMRRGRKSNPFAPMFASMRPGSPRPAFISNPRKIFGCLKAACNFCKRVRGSGTDQHHRHRHLRRISNLRRKTFRGHDTRLAPTTIYARCKNELRLALEADAADERSCMFCWARVFYPYGPGEHPSRLCSSIIQKLSRDEKIVLKTPEAPRITFTLTTLLPRC